MKIGFCHDSPMSSTCQEKLQPKNAVKESQEEFHDILLEFDLKQNGDLRQNTISKEGIQTTLKTFSFDILCVMFCPPECKSVWEHEDEEKFENELDRAYTVGMCNAWSTYIDLKGSLLPFIEIGDEYRVISHDLYLIPRTNGYIASLRMRICLHTKGHFLTHKWKPLKNTQKWLWFVLQAYGFRRTTWGKRMAHWFSHCFKRGYIFTTHGIS